MDFTSVQSSQNIPLGSPYSISWCNCFSIPYLGTQKARSPRGLYFPQVIPRHTSFRGLLFHLLHRPTIPDFGGFGDSCVAVVCEVLVFRIAVITFDPYVESNSIFCNENPTHHFLQLVDLGMIMATDSRLGA